LDSDLRRRLIEKAKEMGLWTLDLPEEIGGAGLSHVARVLIYREFGRTALPFEPPAIPAIIAKSLHARKITRGELSVSLAFAEIHRTTNVSEIRAAYRKDSSGYHLNSFAIDLFNPSSELFLLPAREEASGKMGLFLIEKATPGVVLDGEADLTADQTVARLTLNECRVESDQLIGNEQDLKCLIATEQLRLAARSLGIAMRCLSDSLEHARNRVTFGRPLASRQAIQWMVEDLSINLRTSAWLTLEAAWKADQGLPYFDAAALAKKRATRMAFEAADTAIQIHGGYGVAKEFPFESFYREARLMRLLYGQEAEIDRAMGESHLRAEHDQLRV
jgi:acyl-CoA dehydrogenase